MGTCRCCYREARASSEREESCDGKATRVLCREERLPICQAVSLLLPEDSNLFRNQVPSVNATNLVLPSQVLAHGA